MGNLLETFSLEVERSSWYSSSTLQSRLLYRSLSSPKCRCWKHLFYFHCVLALGLPVAEKIRDVAVSGFANFINASQQIQKSLWSFFSQESPSLMDVSNTHTLTHPKQHIRMYDDILLKPSLPFFPVYTRPSPIRG